MVIYYLSILYSFLPSLEYRLRACSQRGVVRTTPLPSFASDCMYSSAAVVGGVQSGLDAVSHAVQEDRDKSRRRAHSAGTTHHLNALNLSKPAGNDGYISWKIFCNYESGFLIVFCTLQLYSIKYCALHRN